MIKTLYKKLLKPLVFKLDPEFVHDSFMNLGELMGTNSVGRSLIGAMYGYKGKDISKIVDGITYKTPILLSAGFDYNARLVSILDKMSFGGEEVGSVTAKPCLGNEKPRLTRAKKSESIVVFKGLKNDGVDEVISRIKRKKIANDFVVGVSIARTNSIECAEIGAGIEDYYYSLKRLVDENIGKYYTINISCPNAFGGETFADVKRLPLLLEKLKTVQTSKPIYVKMPINLEWSEFNDLLDIIDSHKLNGVVIGNLNKNYEDLDYRDEAPKNYRGGLSGKPCRVLSNNLIEKTRSKFGDKKTIIGVGGILTAQDAIEKFRLGADLVQLITGMIFEGPHLINEIAQEYSKYR
jgi:dihydroorotate dehydrogenase subfamily 2